MPIFKNNKLKIGLLLILFITAILSVYSIWNVPLGSSTISNHMPPQNVQVGNNTHLMDSHQAPPANGAPPSSGHMPGPNGGMFGGKGSSSTNYSVEAITLPFIFTFCMWSVKSDRYIP